MKITLFTVEEASKLARTLVPQLETLVALRREMRRIESRIDVVTLTLAGASAGNPDAAEARALTERRSDLAARVQRGLEAIHKHGCVVKDLEQGLLDFYSIVGDRVIFLCWKLGEPEITHWHTLDGGFATRQPLDKSPLED